MNNFKYSEIVNQDEATMLLFGAIGYEIDGNLFASEMKWLVESGYKKINVLINSVGGSVIEGYSIIAALDIANQKGAEVKMTNIGVAYSMAGVILAAGKKGKREVYDYSSTMIHDPSFSGDKDPEDEGQKKFLETTRNALRMILADNMEKEESEVDELMKNETWYNAKESIANGMADKMIATGKKMEEEPANMYERMVACADLYKNVTNQKTNYNNENQKDMTKINNLLQLNPEASAEAQASAIEKLIAKANKVDSLNDELTTANNKIKTLEDKVTAQETEALKVKATALVEKAVEDGKIKEDAKQSWIDNAVNNYESTETMINSLTVAPGKINDELEGENVKELAAKYEKLLTKDPAQLDNMEESEVAKMEKAFEKINSKIDFTVE